MIYAAPMPFREALDSQEARALLPTDFRSADLAQLDAALLRRAQFSAQVTDLGHLDELGTIYRDILAGRLDVATGRLRAKQYLARHGKGAASTNDGGLQDFASDPRINLQIGVNVEMMRGLGNELQGQQPEVLDAYPAQELIRVLDRKLPRDWIDRWDAARAATTMDGATSAKNDGRMVALKGHPIWVEISRFKNPYPPFDYNSGMGLEDRSRREAMALGIIDRDTQIFPDQSLLRPDANVQTSAAVNDPRLRAALEKTGIGRFDSAGVFRLIEDDSSGPITNREYMRDENGRFASAAAGAVAVEKALSTKGDVMNAMSRPDVGPIDFRWGNEKMGLAHIVARGDAREAKFKDGLTGGDIARKMPDIIAHGTITQRGHHNVVIEHAGYRAILSKQWNGKPSSHWLLSGYDLDPKKKGNR